MSGARHAGLSATGKIERDAWGLNWNVALEQGGWLVGKEIKLEIAIAADEVAVGRAASSRPPPPDPAPSADAERPIDPSAPPRP